MNVFVLCTGRCGSTTFIEACHHIRNYTSGHESKRGQFGPERFQYPDNHIESDNRLSWFLGRVEELYGDNAYYVHLIRDKTAVAKSLHQQYLIRASSRNIMCGYMSLLSIRATPDQIFDLCQDFWEEVNRNIRVFLSNKSRVMTFQMENAANDFAKFWDWIGATGDQNAALAEWTRKHNAMKPKRPAQPVSTQVLGKMRRIIKKLPRYLHDA